MSAFIAVTSEADVWGTRIGLFVAAAFAAIQGYKGRIIAKATKVVAEETKAAVDSPALQSVVLDLTAKLANMTGALSGMATKDALDVFSARMDSFRSTMMIEIGKASESSRQLGERFDKVKTELYAKVDGVVLEVNAKLAELDAVRTPTAGD